MTENNLAAGAASPSVTEVLTRARERVAKGWCKGHPAETASGAITFADSPHATSWCMAGALMAEGVTVGPGYELLDDRHPAVRLIEKAVGRRRFGDWNDEQGDVTTVLAAFDKAIALSEGNATPREAP